jgi:hypothetical protein
VQGDQPVRNLTEEMNVLCATVLTGSDIERELVTFELPVFNLPYLA